MEREYKLILAMVGLPARGKSYISRKLCRFLQWSGLKCRIFNNGEYRRCFSSHFTTTAEFFDCENEEGFKEREKLAICALNDVVQYLLSNFYYHI